jgi:prevent-host-death family protein
MESIKTTNLRHDFANVLNKVYYTNTPVFIERYGKNIAVLISIDDYQELQRIKGKKPKSKAS